MLATIPYLLPSSLPAFVTLGENVCQVLWCLTLLNSCSCWRVNLTNKLCMCLRFFFKLDQTKYLALSKQPRQGLPRRYKGLSTLKMQVGCIQGRRNPVRLPLCFCCHRCYSVLTVLHWNQMLHSAETARLLKSVPDSMTHVLREWTLPH